MQCFSQNETISILGLIIATLTFIAAALVVPEVRSLLHLSPYYQVAGLRRRELIMSFLLYMALCIAIGTIIWILICPSLLKGRNKLTDINTYEEPVRQEPSKVGPAEVFPPVIIEGPDGYASAFYLYIFTREFHWRKGTTIVELNRTEISQTDMVSYLSGIHGDMKSEDALVCIGTASFDVENGEQGEEVRALDRANQLIVWTRAALRDANISPRLYTLNLGHYRQQPDSDDQRLIIIVGIKKLDPQADIDNLMSEKNKESLKKKLREKDFQFNFESYSSFELRKAS